MVVGVERLLACCHDLVAGKPKRSGHWFTPWSRAWEHSWLGDIARASGFSVTHIINITAQVIAVLTGRPLDSGRRWVADGHTLVHTHPTSAEAPRHDDSRSTAAEGETIEVTPRISGTFVADVGARSVLFIALPIVIMTGLLSYIAYGPQFGQAIPGDVGWLKLPLFDWPTRPSWLYRLTEGLHVGLGLVIIPVVLAKLWSVIRGCSRGRRPGRSPSCWSDCRC